MIHEASLQAVHHNTRNGRVWPLYGSYCYSEIIPSIHALYRGEFHPLHSCYPEQGNHDIVIIILIDGFGWSLFERLKDSAPLLSRLEKHGTISALTTQFPSTTTACVTSIHAGLPVTETGIIEWIMYEPNLNKVIEPITFHYLRREHTPHTFDQDAAPGIIFPFQNHYHRLKEYGVDSTILIDGSLAGSRYSQRMHEGAFTVPFSSLNSGLESLVEIVKKTTGRRYIYMYYDLLDSLAHRNGPYGQKVYGAAYDLFRKLESNFLNHHIIKDRKPLVLMTADHGQIGADYKATIYLDEIYPEILSHIRRDGVSGELIAPVGSPRNLFLFLKPERKVQVIGKLKDLLQDKALVLSSEESIALGLWNRIQPQRLIERIGDAVILPNSGETIWIREGGKWQTKFLGYHGGLSPEEMVVPLFAWQYS